MSVDVGGVCLSLFELSDSCCTFLTVLWFELSTVDYWCVVLCSVIMFYVVCCVSGMWLSLIVCDMSRVYDLILCCLFVFDVMCIDGVYIYLMFIDVVWCSVVVVDLVWCYLIGADVVYVYVFVFDGVCCWLMLIDVSCCCCLIVVGVVCVDSIVSDVSWLGYMLVDLDLIKHNHVL